LSFAVHGAWRGLTFKAWRPAGPGISLACPRQRRQEWHFAFKNIRWNRRQSSRAFVLIALAIGSIVLYSHLALLLIASAYCVHGIVLELVRLVRHRLTSRLA
jgi:hypothetical protein